MNNSWDNLQDITNWENQQNKSISTQSGVTGVTWESSTNMWIVRLTVLGKRTYLGCSSDLEEATNIRKAAELKYAIELGTP